MNWLVRPFVAVICLLCVCTADAAAQGGNQLAISRAEADPDAGILRIYGRNFVAPNGALPAVTLAGLPLVVQSIDNTFIQAWLPARIAPGSYLVIVSRGNGTPQNDSFSVTIGAAGPAGATGPQGAQGDPGARGEPGVQGPTGAQGQPGATGATGAQGQPGATGATGPQGAQGDQGPQGVQGEPGPKGNQGDAGAQGPTGAQGPQGATGTQGPAGAQGATGAQGFPGATGPQGPIGPPGPIGPTGPAGAGGTGISAATNMTFSVDDRVGWTHVESLADDTCTLNIPLGFTFTGFGASTTSVSLASNGILFFGQGCFTNFTNTALPTNLTSNPALFFFWDDLQDFGTGEFVEYMTLGSAPGRVFYMWFVMRVRNFCGTDQVQVMVSAHEGSNLVTANYKVLTGCPQLRGAAATFGLQAAGGVAAENVSVGFNVPALDDNAFSQFLSFKP